MVKKHFIPQVAALALSGMLCSCSHDMDFGQDTRQKYFQDVYEHACGDDDMNDILFLVHGEFSNEITVIENEPIVRIICEDLTVDENSDFDFNDVVFDVTPNRDLKTSTITLQAAGGTLELEVAGHEVHQAFGVATNVMVNTGAGVSKSPVSFTIDGYYDTPAKTNAIEVRVKKNGEWYPLSAHKGKPASKIAVTTTYQWCNERQDIEEVYPKFKSYVGEAWLDESWYN